MFNINAVCSRCQQQTEKGVTEELEKKPRQPDTVSRIDFIKNWAAPAAALLAKDSWKDIIDGKKASTSATLLLRENKYTIDEKRNK